MLTEFTVRDFKSFREGTLHFAPVTVLVGPNASGKSNILEALQLLSWLARGRRLSDILLAAREHELGLRGSPASLVRAGSGAETGLSVTIDCFSVHEAGHDVPPLFLDVKLRVDSTGVFVVEETLGERGSISHPGRKRRIPPYYVAKAVPGGATRSLQGTVLGEGSRRPRVTWSSEQLVLAQRWNVKKVEQMAIENIDLATHTLTQELDQVFFIDVVPRLMRGYAFKLEVDLKSDGANLSAVLYRLCQKEKLKDAVLEFVRALPEENVLDLDFIATPRNEVMLKLMEAFGRHERWTEAALLSDGTLRVLAVAAAMHSVPKSSVLVIEEIDNGLHPSRAAALLANIERVAERRDLQVVITTHSPALLDALSDNMLRAVQVCFRQRETGESQIVRLADLPRFPEIMAQGRLGNLVTRGILERFLNSSAAQEKSRRAVGEKWLAGLRRGLGT